jgi:hypothetical protein
VSEPTELSPDDFPDADPDDDYTDVPTCAPLHPERNPPIGDMFPDQAGA